MTQDEAADRQSANECLIVGLGNPAAGDDGAGIAAAMLIREREIPAEASVAIAGTDGFALVDMLRKHKKIIIIDAARMGLKPGEWRRFWPENVEEHFPGDFMSLHQASALQCVRMARELGGCGEVVIFGIQPGATERFNPGAGTETSLTPEVKQACSEVADKVCHELAAKIESLSFRQRFKQTMLAEKRAYAC